MNKKMRMFQALLIVAILLLQMIIPIVPIYAKTSENIWKETFENGVDGWKFFDADGDGDTWSCFDERESAYYAFKGNYMLTSDSFNHLPDNYAVSPAIAINQENVSDYDKIKISWYVAARSDYACDETYSVSVYVDDGSNISIDKLKDLNKEYSHTLKGGGNYSIASFVLKTTDYVGKNIRLVFHHKNSSIKKTDALQIDEISVDAFYSNTSVIQGFGFEEGEEGWSFIDADGDGRNWKTSDSFKYEGKIGFFSFSKVFSSYNPQNYAISPIVDVSGKTNLQLDWYASAVGSKNAYKEHYAVYIYPYNNEEDSSKVPTVEDISKLTPVFEETLDTYGYTKKTVDLNKYINYDKIRVIFYHYIPEGGSAQSRLLIDSISITGIGGASHTANFFVDGTLFNSQLYNEGSSILSPAIISGKGDDRLLSPVFVPGKEGYTFVGWEPEVKVMGTEDIDFNAVFSESTAKLENIKIAKQPTKLEYTEGENFDRTGMEVKACYSDGTEVGVTNYCKTTNGENLSKGQTNVTITYREDDKTVETTQTITVKEKPPVVQKALESIKITTPPTKTVYTEGEKFNPEGMKVTATYSDETTEEVTDYIYTPTKELTTGDTTITVSYTENEITKLATQAITVKAKPPVAQKTLESIKITKQPTKLEYTEGESFDKTGMEVKACYSDKTETVITNYEITNGENLTKGQTSVTIKYTEGEKTVEATQAITVKAEDPNTEKTIQFKDENLYKAIKETLREKVISFSDKDFKVTALKSDVESIDILNLKKDDNAEDTIKITDISGIENFKGLTKLYSSNNQISDIRALSGLTNLTELYLSNNQISDIRALSGLTNLTNLYLYNNQITKNILKTEDEVELPQIFKAAKEQNSKVYTEEEYEFENCELTADKTKVKLKEKGKNASVKIIGGNADGTTLNIVAVDEIPKELTGIEIASYSGKIIYTEGEDFDTSTLKIEAKYSDNSSKELKEGEYEIVDGKNLKVGQNSVTIRYTEGEKTVETTHTIAVKAKEPEVEKTLSKIEITTAPTKTTYTEGEKFDKAGMKVTATYSDGTTKEVTDYTYTPAGELKTTDTAITVSYKEGEKTVEAKYTITVKAKPPVAQKTLESIKVTTAPTRTTYTEGEKFDKAGMKVIATYSDGTTKEIKNYAYTPAGELTKKDTTITVSYTENEVTKIATQEITVVAKGNSGDEPGGETEKAKLDSIEIKEAPTKTVYTEGEKFDKTGMKVIAKYSDGTTKEIKNYAYTPAGALTKKDTTITVSYTENGVTKTDTQKIKIQNKDDGTGAKDKFPDTGAQIPIISGIVLMFAVAVASVVKIKRLTGI